MNATRWSTPPSARCTTPAWRSKPRRCCWPSYPVRTRPITSCSAWPPTPSGAATRLQWGTTYLASLIDLAPQDRARIDAAAAALLRDIAATPDAFQQRNRTQLQRAAAKLAELPQAGEHASALLRAIAAGLG